MSSVFRRSMHAIAKRGLAIWHNGCLQHRMHTPSPFLSFPPIQGTSSLWQHQLNLLLDSTGEGIFGIDMDGRCVFINRAGAAMLGWSANDLLGMNMHEVTHHSHADGSTYPDTECPIFNAFRQGLPCRIDTEVFWRRERTSFAVEYSSYPILDGQAPLGTRTSPSVR